MKNYKGQQQRSAALAVSVSERMFVPIGVARVLNSNKNQRN